MYNHTTYESFVSENVSIQFLLCGNKLFSYLTVAISKLMNRFPDNKEYPDLEFAT